MPRARSVGNSSPRASISRASACPTITTPVKARSPEAAQSVTTGTRFTAWTSGVYTEAAWGGAARGIWRRRISSANAGRSLSPCRSATPMVSSSVSAAGRWARKNAGVSPTRLGKPRPVRVSKLPTTAITPTRRSACARARWPPAVTVIAGQCQGHRHHVPRDSARVAPRRRSSRPPHRWRRGRGVGRGRPSPRRRGRHSASCPATSMTSGNVTVWPRAVTVPENRLDRDVATTWGRRAISAKIRSVSGLPPVVTAA